jgi:hypothetical protein
MTVAAQPSPELLQDQTAGGEHVISLPQALHQRQHKNHGMVKFQRASPANPFPLPKQSVACRATTNILHRRQLSVQFVTKLHASLSSYSRFIGSVVDTSEQFFGDDFFSWHGFTTVPSLSRIGPLPNFRLNRLFSSAIKDTIIFFSASGLAGWTSQGDVHPH